MYKLDGSTDNALLGYTCWLVAYLYITVLQLHVCERVSFRWGL